MRISPAATYVPAVSGLAVPINPASPVFNSAWAHPQSWRARHIPPGWLPRGEPWTLTACNPTTIPVVQVGHLWLLQETVTAQAHAPWSRSPLDIARAAVQQGQQRLATLRSGLLTQHALLVAWGEFAQEIGLLQKLGQLDLPIKSVAHTPQAKVLTFLLGILTGIEHLKDLNEGPHPLAHDGVAIRPWGLVALAHYTNISRTLAACDPDTIVAIVQVLQEVSQPFIDQEVDLVVQQGQPLIIDLDLAPRRVSDTSTTFPGAEFGWQGDRVGLGYDAALVALTSPTYGRLFLAGFHHPRHTVSLPRLQKMVQAAEECLGRRPRRRTELVAQRVQALRQTIQQRQDWWAAQLQRQRELQDQLASLPRTITQWQDEVAALAATYQAQGRTEKPHSRLAQARHRLARAQKKLPRVARQLQQAQQAAATHQQRLAQLQTEYETLLAHLQRLRADNEQNPQPVTIILRLDAGFGSGANLTWLIEMGYIVYTKAHNAQVATGLLHQLPPDATWTPVGQNAEMIAWGAHQITNCPYPLTVALERFHIQEEQKHSTLISYRDDGQCLTSAAWFDFYNGRQIIEAGIKEGNVVFKMHPLKMRSPGGIALQEQFTLFAANFVRWAMVWLRERITCSTSRFATAVTRIKAMVRLAANTSAWVVETADGLLIQFDETSTYPGVELRLAGTWRVHPPLLPPEKVHVFDFKNDPTPGCT